MNIYEQRLSRVRTEMALQGLDTLILTPGAAMRYLTGFSEEGYERLLALIVPDDQPWLFITPAINAEQVRANPAGVTDVRVWDDAGGWETLLAEVFVDLTLDIGIVGLDESMPARFALKIQGLAPTTLLKLAGSAIEPLRAAKDTLELAAMQHAADVTDSLIPIVYDACKIGATERSVALAIETSLNERGHTTSFGSIIGAGANGALPHHHTGKTRIKSGDVMVLDFGAKVDGYCGDITRVAAIEHASDEAKRVYEIVYAAHQAAVAAVQPGATGHDVDAAARKVIADAGYGDFFLHRTGHGIGLEDHESPYIVEGNRIKLQPGNCCSIEPGIYLPGKFGVRLENIFTVTEDGAARVFNEAIAPEIPILG
ncbi:dipeptidase [Capsulimonas corticalis]|uniref:Dipeptidase n=1 Tax=Capsulimonas corticalis TaxID=2219043 RepID=A0A402D2F5_9BACT|nr:Xaa-Pro peptidase family protein [Capsulimonas corticalis]BDI30019.1 dipeptidase [Capsulimonas corticalis]